MRSEKSQEYRHSSSAIQTEKNLEKSIKRAKKTSLSDIEHPFFKNSKSLNLVSSFTEDKLEKPSNPKIDSLSPESEADDSFEKTENFEKTNLIGLKKRIEIQPKLISSSKKIEKKLILSSKMLENYIVSKQISNFEILNNYHDNFPLLNFRKALLRIKLFISELSKLIITNPIVKGFIILVILLNVLLLVIENWDYKSGKN